MALGFTHTPNLISVYFDLFPPWQLWLPAACGLTLLFSVAVWAPSRGWRHSLALSYAGTVVTLAVAAVVAALFGQRTMTPAVLVSIALAAVIGAAIFLGPPAIAFYLAHRATMRTRLVVSCVLGLLSYPIGAMAYVVAGCIFGAGCP